MSLTGTAQFTEKARIVLQANKEGVFDTEQTSQINYRTTVPFKTNARTNCAQHLLSGIKEIHKKDLKTANKAFEFINQNFPENRTTKNQHPVSKRKRLAEDDPSGPEPKKQNTCSDSNDITVKHSTNSKERFLDVITRLEVISKRHSGLNGPIISSPECRTWRLNHKEKIEYAKQLLGLADRTDTASQRSREKKLDELRRNAINMSKNSPSPFAQTCHELQTYSKWRQTIANAEKEYGIDPSVMIGAEWLKRHTKGIFLRQYHEKIRKINKEAGISEARFKAYQKCIEKEKAKPTLSEDQVAIIMSRYIFAKKVIVKNELGADLEIDAWVIKYPRRIPEKDVSAIFSNATKAFRYAAEAEIIKTEILEKARDIERRLAGRAFPHECRPLSAIPPHLRYLMKKTERKGNGDGPGRINCSPRPMMDALKRYAMTIGRSRLTEQYNNTHDANDIIDFDNIKAANKIEELDNTNDSNSTSPGSMDWETTAPKKEPAEEIKKPVIIPITIKKAACRKKSAKGEKPATTKHTKIFWKTKPISA